MFMQHDCLNKAHVEQPLKTYLSNYWINEYILKFTVWTSFKQLFIKKEQHSKRETLKVHK